MYFSVRVSILHPPNTPLTHFCDGPWRGGPGVYKPVGSGEEMLLDCKLFMLVASKLSCGHEEDEGLRSTSNRRERGKHGRVSNQSPKSSRRYNVLVQNPDPRIYHYQGGRASCLVLLPGFATQKSGPHNKHLQHAPLLEHGAKCRVYIKQKHCLCGPE